MAPLPTNSTITFAQLVPSHIPIQFTNQNYPLWRSLFISFFKASNMLDFVEGREQCPPQTEALAYADWLRRDQILLTWINSAIPVSLLVSTREFTSGRALWFHLKNVHMTYVLRLRDRLTNLDYTKFTKSDKSIAESKEEYIKEAKLIADTLEEAGSPVKDSELVSFILDGLPDTYEDFIDEIRDRREPVTVEQLRKLLVVFGPPQSSLDLMLLITFLTIMLWLATCFLYLCINYLLEGVVSYKILKVLFVVCVLLAASLVLSAELPRRRRRKTSSDAYERLPDSAEYMSV